MKQMPRLALVAAMIVLMPLTGLIGLLLGAAADPKRDNPVPEAARWVDHFRGLTVERVRRELGKPTAENQWKANGVSGPLLVYEFTPESKLQLFTLKGEVMSALLTVESK